MTSSTRDEKLIPLFSHLFAPYDKIIGSQSLVLGMRALLVRLFGVRGISVYGLTRQTNAILQSSPVVLLCNHPFDSEVIILLGSLPKRQTIRLIGADSQVRMGSEFAKYIIKVYPFRQEAEGKNLKLSSKVARYTYRKRANSNTDELVIQNRKAIDEAADYVNKGGMVVMFPQGTSSNIEWRPGIGFLLSKITNYRKTYLCFAYIKDSSNFDLIRFIPGLNWIIPHPSLFFNDPIPLSKSDLQKKPQEIKQLFETRYKQWIHQLQRK